MKLVNLNIIIGLITLFRLETLDAQQMPLYSQYMMNGFVINPAVAGSDGYTTLALSSRDHMLGFDNSPKTFVFSFQSRVFQSNYRVRSATIFRKRSVVKRSGKVGIGALVYTDRNGYVERTGGQFAYAYHLATRDFQLSLGMAVSTFQFKLNTSKLNFIDQEPLMNSNYSNKVLVPDATIGAYFVKDNAFAGLSVANMFQTRINIGSGNDAYDYRMYRNYYLLGGVRFLPEETFSYEPSILLKGTEKGVVQSDIQMRLCYLKDYYIGATVRTGAAVGLLVGAKWERLHFGYAFDYSLTPLQRFSIGSHELNLVLKLGDNARRYRWLIRY